MGLTQKHPFERCNPQGFNKHKLPGCNKDYANVYRHPNAPNFEDKENKADYTDDDQEYLKNSHPQQLKLENFVALKSPSVMKDGENSPEAKPSPHPVIFNDDLKEKKTPNVQNPNDFPALSSCSKDSTIENTNSEASANKRLEKYLTNWNKITQSSFKTPPKKVSNISYNKVAVKPHKDRYSLRNTTGMFPKYMDKPETMAKNAQFTNLEMDDPIFLIGRKDVILDSNVKLAKPHHKVLDTKIAVQMCIAFLYDPSHFYFHYDESTLKYLINSMHKYYDNLAPNELLIHENNLQKNLLVAAKIFNYWHRAVICGKKEDMIRLKICDFGDCLLVHRQNIRYMVEMFIDIPVLCCKGRVAGIVPNNTQQPSSDWCAEAVEFFYNRAFNQPLFMTIRSYNVVNDIYEVELSEQITSSITIGEEMVKEKYAKPISLNSTFPYAIIFTHNHLSE